MGADGMKLVGAERMPLSDKETPAVNPRARGRTIAINYDESPVFLRWDARPPAK